MNLSEVKAAATAKMNGPIGLEQQNTLAYFALAAIPIIESAPRMSVWELQTALAKLREG